MKKFQSLEKIGGIFPNVGKKQSGSALIVTLWVIMILGLLISTFAYDMRIEAGVASYARKRIKAQYLSRAGVEWAKVALMKKVPQQAKGEELVVEEGDDESMVLTAVNLSRGVGVRDLVKALGEGAFRLDILPEEGRRNVNKLTDQDWEEILDQSGVPEEDWPDLIDCFQDWIDEGDEHRLNGAESDDPYYKERGYKVKNAPLDTVDELLLIKGFDESIVYGGPSKKKDGEMLGGIAHLLTTWGDGRVNVNTATREVLMTLLGMDEWVVTEILERRNGPDGIPGTKDDGFDSVDQVISETGMKQDLRDKITTTERKYLRVVSIGEVQGVRSGIWCVLQVEGSNVIPVFWREEDMP